MACESVLRGEVAEGREASLCALIEGSRRLEEEGSTWASFDKTEDWVNLVGAILCVTLAAFAAGLTMGIVSLDEIDLRIKMRSAEGNFKDYAAKLLPLVTKQPHHQLLVTLLLLNACVNEALPLFLDKLVPAWAAVLIAVTAVLFVGEIIPAAIFTGPAKFAIAASLSGFTWLLVYLLSPLAWPIGWALDKLIPEEGGLPCRAEVRALVEVQREIAHEINPDEAFTEDEADLVRGAMSLSSALVLDVMTPKEDIFSLPAAGTVLDRSTMERIKASGTSRIPVYTGADVSSAYAYLRTSQLITLNPEDATPLESLHLYQPIWVAPDHSLFDLLNDFQAGRTHMAFVSRRPELSREASSTGVRPSGSSGCVGLITLEDIMEEILTEEIYDEADREKASQTIRGWLTSMIKQRRVAPAASRRTGRSPSDRSTPKEASGRRTGRSASERSRRSVASVVGRKEVRSLPILEGIADGKDGRGGSVRFLL